jgi:hypothetical protein
VWVIHYYMQPTGNYNFHNKLICLSGTCTWSRSNQNLKSVKVELRVSRSRTWNQSKQNLESIKAELGINQSRTWNQSKKYKFLPLYPEHFPLLGSQLLYNTLIALWQFPVWQRGHLVILRVWFIPRNSIERNDAWRLWSTRTVWLFCTGDGFAYKKHILRHCVHCMLWIAHFS